MAEHENTEITRARTSEARTIRPDFAANTGTASEASELASELRRAFVSMVEDICKYHDVKPNEAVTDALQRLAPYQREIAAELEDQVGQNGNQRYRAPGTWWDLERLLANDPEALERRWEAIKQDARDDLHSGHLAARVTEGIPAHSSPQDRARFLALREALMQDWQPRPGVEQMLVDTLAQAQTLYQYWLLQLMTWTGIEDQHQQNNRKYDGWQLPRVSSYEAMEQAAAMVDRFNRVMLRTLRQLRDLRRYAPQVTIQNAEQVNIGAQQINAVKSEK